MQTDIETTGRNTDLKDDELLQTDEPATEHDIIEGGALGVVGGAIVGALAGGPIGAVIGAVVGGAASAAGVAVVDQHDHDYEKIVAHTHEAGEVDMTSPGAAYLAERADYVPLEAPAAPEEEVDAEIQDTHSRILLRAYEIYELRGKADGLALRDWLQAENEILV